MKNQAALLTGAKTIEIFDTDMPNIGPDEVLIEVSAMTICGSDMQLFTDPTVGGMFPDIKLPVLMGHECAGRVVECGSAVRNVACGDRVAIEPGVPCGKCEYCKSGRYNICPDVLFMAAPPFTTGATQRYIKHSASYVYKLPDNVTDIQGALIEPLSVGMQAVKRSGAEVHSTVLILGAGCIGHMTAEACRMHGIHKIIMADLFDNRLELARQHDSRVRTINSKTEDLKERVMQLTNGEGADVVFETAGSAYTTQIAPDLLRQGGTIAMVGTPHGGVDFSFGKMNFKEGTVVSVFRYCNTYPTAIDALQDGILHPEYVVSDVFSFEDTQKAFEQAVYNKQESLKVAIRF